MAAIYHGDGEAYLSLHESTHVKLSVKKIKNLIDIIQFWKLCFNINI